MFEKERQRERDGEPWKKRVYLNNKRRNIREMAIFRARS